MRKKVVCFSVVLYSLPMSYFFVYKNSVTQTRFPFTIFISPSMCLIIRYL